MDGWLARERIEEGMSRFGLADLPHDRPLVELSGGQRRRLALACALGSGADVLLLDEPTAHLDLAARSYLAERLRQLPGAAIVATHDRHILATSCTGRLHIADRALGRLPAAADPPVARRTPAFLEANPRESRGTALEARHLTIARGGRIVLDDLDIRLEPGDRVAVLGPNGSGKSAFLSLLAGEAASDDPRGTRRYGPGIRLFWAGQDDRGIAPNATPLEQLERWVSGARARQLLGLARLPRGAWSELPSTLSGGERARAGLAAMIACEANLLLLDEPEAHLDLEGVDLLQRVLGDSRSTLVFASHDRALVDGLATRVVALLEGTLVDLPRGAAEYVERMRSARESVAAASLRPLQRLAVTPRHAPAHGQRSPAEATVTRPSGTILEGRSRAVASAHDAESSGAATEAEGGPDASALETLEDERTRLEDALLDPLALPERERLRLDRRLREVIDDLSERYDRLFPSAPPRVAVVEDGLRFGAIPTCEGLEIEGPADLHVHVRVRRVGRTAHIAATAAVDAELVPWVGRAAIRAAARLTFYLLDVDAVQTQARAPLREAGFRAAGAGWWVMERSELEAAEGWARRCERAHLRAADGKPAT